MYIGKRTLLKAFIVLGTIAVVVSKGSKPRLLSKAKKKYTVNEGGKIKLKCKVTGAKDPDHNRTLTAWRKDGAPPRNSIIRKSPVWDRFKVKNGEYLRIRNVQKQDGGTYWCIAKNQHGMVHAIIELAVIPRPNSTLSYHVTSKSYQSPKPTVVIKAPRFRHKQTKHHAIQKAQGKELRLECQAKGSPRPKVTWFKNNKPMKKTRGKRIRKTAWALSIRRLKQKDSGIYRCLVWNEHGNLTRTFYVQVIGKDFQDDSGHPPSAKPVIQENLLKNATAKEGESVTFTCAAISDSAPQFAWVKWITLNRTNNLNMTYKVLNSSEPNVRFVREASRWVSGGISYSQKLKLLNVTKEDQGQYTCFVGTDGTTIVSSHVFLTVQQSIAVRRTTKTTSNPPHTLASLSQFPLAAIIAVPVVFITIFMVAIIWCVIQTMKHRNQFNAKAASLQPVSNGLPTSHYLETYKNGNLIYQLKPEAEKEPEVMQLGVTYPEITQPKVTHSHVMNGVSVRNGLEIRSRPEVTKETEVTQHEPKYEPEVTQCEYNYNTRVTPKEEIRETHLNDSEEFQETQLNNSRGFPVTNVYTDNPTSTENIRTQSNNNIATLSGGESTENISSKTLSNLNRTTPTQEARHDSENYLDCSNVAVGADGNCTDTMDTISHMNVYSSVV